jgi:hypothetical protein
MLIFAAATAVCAPLLTYVPLMVLELLPMDPVWLRPAAGVLGFALALLAGIFMANRFRRRS